MKRKPREKFKISATIYYPCQLMWRKFTLALFLSSFHRWVVGFSFSFLNNIIQHFIFISFLHLSRFSITILGTYFLCVVVYLKHSCSICKKCILNNFFCLIFRRAISSYVFHCRISIQDFIRIKCIVAIIITIVKRTSFHNCSK